MQSNTPPTDPVTKSSTPSGTTSPTATASTPSTSPTATASTPSTSATATANTPSTSPTATATTSTPATPNASVLTAQPANPSATVTPTNASVVTAQPATPAAAGTYTAPTADEMKAITSAAKAARHSAIEMTKSIIKGVNRLVETHTIPPARLQPRIQQTMDQNISPYRMSGGALVDSPLAIAFDAMESKLIESLCPPLPVKTVRDQLEKLDEHIHKMHNNFLKGGEFKPDEWNKAFKDAYENVQTNLFKDPKVLSGKTAKEVDDAKSTFTTDLKNLQTKSLSEHFAAQQNFHNRKQADIRSALWKEAIPSSPNNTWTMLVKGSLSAKDIKDDDDPKFKMQSDVNTEPKVGLWQIKGSDVLIKVEEKDGQKFSTMLPFDDRKGFLGGLDKYEAGERLHFDFMQKMEGATVINLEAPGLRPEQINVEKLEIQVKIAKEKGLGLNLASNVEAAIAYHYSNKPKKRDALLKDIKEANEKHVTAEANYTNTAQGQMHRRADQIRIERASAKSGKTMTDKLVLAKPKAMTDQEFKSSLTDTRTGAPKVGAIDKFVNQTNEQIKLLKQAQAELANKAKEKPVHLANKGVVDTLHTEVTAQIKELKSRITETQNLVKSAPVQTAELATRSAKLEELQSQTSDLTTNVANTKTDYDTAFTTATQAKAQADAAKPSDQKSATL